MALTNEQITAQNFKDFYGQIRPYLNGAAHSGFTPVGTVISVMGKTAPMNYLVCDGTVYNIADYSELANYFAGQFEAANFFGGDGVTTFAVPDLRGEFLRGTGTNSHANQGSGANVGVHQDATEHPAMWWREGNAGIVMSGNDGSERYIDNADSSTPNTSINVFRTEAHYGATHEDIYTSRPTNTSVLYCIATKNIFMDAGMNFSTEEQVVGTWIDGKKLYRRVLTSNSALANNQEIALGNVDTVIVKDFVAYNATGLFTPMAQGLYASNTFDSSYYYDPLKHSLVLQLGNEFVTSRGTGGYRLIVEYTKTTI